MTEAKGGIGKGGFSAVGIRYYVLTPKPNFLKITHGWKKNSAEPNYRDK